MVCILLIQHNHCKTTTNDVSTVDNVSSRQPLSL